VFFLFCLPHCLPNVVIPQEDDFNSMAHSVIRDIAGRKLVIETGKLANQAGGSVLVTYGETVVLVAATAASVARDGIDFLPLTVDYEERSYAAGKIPGSFFP